MALCKKIMIVAGNLSHLDQFVIHGFFKELSESSSVLLAIPESEMGSQRWAELSPHIKGFFTQVISYEYGSIASSSGSQLGEASTSRFRKNATGYRTRLRNKFLIGLGIPVTWKTVAGLKRFGEIEPKFGDGRLKRLLRWFAEQRFAFGFGQESPCHEF